METMLRLAELHGVYPLFVMHDAAMPPIEAGRVCTLSWKWVDEDVSATTVCESGPGEGLFFRIPRATDFEGVRGITGPALAAFLFSKNEASVAITDIRVSPSDLCAELQDDRRMFVDGLVCCSSIW
jgi:hypothetical protein